MYPCSKKYVEHLYVPRLFDGANVSESLVNINGEEAKTKFRFNT